MVNRRFELAAIDLDDTLLDGELGISGQNREAVARAVSEGVKIVLASGRNFGSMKKYADILGIGTAENVMICSNGSEIIASGSGTVIFEKRIDTETARGIIAFVESKGHIWVHYENGVINASGQNEWTDEDVRLTGHVFSLIRDRERELSQPRLKFVIPDEPARIDVLRKELCERFGESVTIFVSKPCFLEILPHGTDKGTTLERVASDFGIPMYKTIAIGDSFNDVSMIARAGFGCAVANAVPEAKKAAQFVSELTCHENAVADILERFVIA